MSSYTYISRREATRIARELTKDLELKPKLWRDDIYAASQAEIGGRYHRALAFVYGNAAANTIMRTVKDRCKAA